MRRMREKKWILAAAATLLRLNLRKRNGFGATGDAAPGREDRSSRGRRNGDDGG